MNEQTAPQETTLEELRPELREVVAGTIAPLNAELVVHATSGIEHLGRSKVRMAGWLARRRHLQQLAPAEE